KDPGPHHRVQHREIDKAEYPGRDRTDQIDALAAEPVRQMPGERDRDKRYQPRGNQRRQKEIARGVQNLRAIGEYKGEIDVSGGLLGHPGEGRQMICFGWRLITSSTGTGSIRSSATRRRHTVDSRV